jgi:hypothetical protein
VQAIPEGTLCHFVSSKILEDWFNIYVNGNYAGTISDKEFKMNFRVDPLLLNEEI